MRFLIAVQSWPAPRIYAGLVLLTLLCLLPFLNRAFHLDDTLFVFAGKQIVQHPLDPYGFQLVWNTRLERMSDVTKNPPLGCYYAALIGWVAGWSEIALHLGFLVPAVAVVLGAYRLAAHFTQWSVLAAALTLFTPGVLVSASSVMCDTMMLALWIWAAIFWIEGLEPRKHRPLLASSLLIAASALAKYFGAALIPLLLVYSIIRLRRLGWWAAYLAVPCLALLGYEIWSSAVYGQGLLASAAEFAGTQREIQQGSSAAHGLVDLSFTGGCTFPALAMIPLLWRLKQLLPAALISCVTGVALVLNWVEFGGRVGGRLAFEAVVAQWIPLSLQTAACILAGLSVLALAIADVWKRRDADSWFLALWLLGTFFFAGFINWTVNARSVLPLIPAACILIARRLERPAILAGNWGPNLLAGGLAASAALSLWVCASDAAWANSARAAAFAIRERTQNERAPVYFLGHWGFQYYMQELGFAPVDEDNSIVRIGDVVIAPQNNTTYAGIDPKLEMMLLPPILDVSPHYRMATMDPGAGAGFYSAYWGPLPFATGKLSPETYLITRMVERQPGH